MTPAEVDNLAARRLARISREHQGEYAFTPDSADAIAARIKGLFSHGRRVTLYRRGLDLAGRGELIVGLTVKRDRPVTYTRTADRANVWVPLSHSPSRGRIFEGFNVPWTTNYSGGNTELEVLQQVRQWENGTLSGLSDVTVVAITGGHDDAWGMEDQLTVRHWNENGYGQEVHVGFDSDDLAEAQRLRENEGYEFGEVVGLRFSGLAYCRQLIPVRGYRVRCEYPIVEGYCAAPERHVAETGDVPR